MPDVHAPDAFIAELQGRVQGAVSVVCHSPFDLECLYAIADLAPRPPASPLKSLAATLEEAPIDWRAWWEHWRSQGGQLPDADVSSDPGPATKVDEPDEPADSDLETLKRVIAVLFYIWKAQDTDDIPLLSCCVSIASESEPPARVHWAGSQPALAFGHGSLWVDIGTATWTARGFIAGLVLGGGIDATSRSAGLVERARLKAIARQRSRPGYLGDLENILTLAPAGIKPNEKLCILVHGLCSTDVGTFDQFEGLIRGRSGKGGNATLKVVGFPHDSLTTDIETNAERLAQAIVNLDAHQCRLVCHSRGGLVARRAAAWLRTRPHDNEPWIHSCVSFGTPHIGTSVASSPGLVTGFLMSIAHLSRSPSVHSLVDILCGVRPGQTYVGVSELVPPAVDGSYVRGLKQMENCLFLDDVVSLRPFGSTGSDRRALISWLIKRILGTQEHDLLVPISSSVPPLSTPGAAAAGRLYGRTHFEYFSRFPWEYSDPPFWQDALTFLGLPTA